MCLRTCFLVPPLRLLLPFSDLVSVEMWVSCVLGTSKLFSMVHCWNSMVRCVIYVLLALGEVIKMLDAHQPLGSYGKKFIILPSFFPCFSGWGIVRFIFCLTFDESAFLEDKGYFKKWFLMVWLQKLIL